MEVSKVEVNEEWGFSYFTIAAGDHSDCQPSGVYRLPCVSFDAYRAEWEVLNEEISGLVAAPCVSRLDYLSPEERQEIQVTIDASSRKRSELKSELRGLWDRIKSDAQLVSAYEFRLAHI